MHLFLPLMRYLKENLRAQSRTSIGKQSYKGCGCELVVCHNRDHTSPMMYHKFNNYDNMKPNKVTLILRVNSSAIPLVFMYICI